MPIKPTTCYIRKDQHDKLRALSGATKVPIAEYIRQAVDAILEEHKSELPSHEEENVAGSAHGPQNDSSEAGSNHP